MEIFVLKITNLYNVNDFKSYCENRILNSLNIHILMRASRLLHGYSSNAKTLTIITSKEQLKFAFLEKNQKREESTNFVKYKINRKLCIQIIFSDVRIRPEREGI